MATCSFIKATDAASLSRNNTLVWTEICELQKAILAAIDGNPCATPAVIGARSVLVAGGTPFTKTGAISSVTLTEAGSGYDITSATATINANGTEGFNATATPTVEAGVITGFSVVGGGKGFQSATIAATGSGYSVNNTLTLVGGIYSSVAQVNVDTVSTVLAQDETVFNGVGANGTFVGGDGAGGTAYAPADTITLNDGTIITVDTVDGDGDVVTFDITTASTSGNANLATLTQSATSGTGVGFTLTLGTANQGVFSVSVATGNEGGYSVVPANPVSTTVTPSGGTGATLTVTFSDGYIPVSATALLASPSNLFNGQTQADYTSRVTFGTDFAPNDTITLSNGAVLTVNTITNDNYVTIVGQTQANYDNGAGNGTFQAGANYEDGDVITLNDGTIVTVLITGGTGNVLTFSIDGTSTISQDLPSQDRVQISAINNAVPPSASAGTGFVLEPNTTNNETRVGPVATFLIDSIGSPIFLPTILTQAGTDTDVVDGTKAIGTGFSLTPVSPTNVELPGVVGTGAILTPVVTNGVITNVVVNAGGSGYLPNTPILISHPSGSGASITATSVGDGTGGYAVGEILQAGIVITAGGTGYETAIPLITISHPVGFGFEGVVQTTGGVVTGISVQDGGQQYQELTPTAAVEAGSEGSGATFTVNTASGSVTSIDVVSGGYDYSVGDIVEVTPAITSYVGTTPVYDTVGVPAASGTVAEVDGSDISNIYYDPSAYYYQLIGQTSDRVIADQIQYVLDYFTALGYNIRAQVNPATNNTIQWQIIW